MVTGRCAAGFVSSSSIPKTPYSCESICTPEAPMWLGPHHLEKLAVACEGIEGGLDLDPGVGLAAADEATMKWNNLLVGRQFI